MAEDFGFGGGGNVVETTPPVEETTNLETGEVGIEGKTNLDANKTGQEVIETNKAGEKTNTSSTGGQEESNLNVGDSVEVDGVNYTVNEDGALVDEKGEVFKTKEEVAELLKDYSTEEVNETSSINIEDIQKLVGVNVEDDKGQAVTFDSTPEGVAQYINACLSKFRFL